MKQYYGHPKFVKYTEEMNETHSCKNHDYADQSDPLSNFRKVYEMTRGIPDSPYKVALQLEVGKMLRKLEISKKGNKVKGETVIDTLMDSANYNILERILIEEYGLDPKDKS